MEFKDRLKALRLKRNYSFSMLAAIMHKSEGAIRSWDPWKGVPLVFTNEIGGHLSDQTVYKHFKKIMASIGLPETRLHDLRHTYAVMSLQAGDDVKTVQEHLGHYTAAFTLDVYGHVTERMQKESARKMQTILDGLKGQSKN